MIGRDEILARVPHSGTMCLIDRALSWDQDQIRCESETHRDLRNPLRRAGALSAVHLIEYGAQAAALHGALLAPDPQQASRAGMLVSVRQCELLIDRLEALPDALRIQARREAHGAEALTYSFEVAHDEQILGRGRLMIRLAGVAPRLDTADR
ncbi:MAG TPA: hypothetical protein VEZ88_09545 [Steroidobacteraceae bacterium]|nr:hypothetical protein [Steroidobacteraceae bacterium]